MNSDVEQTLGITDVNNKVNTYRFDEIQNCLKEFFDGYMADKTKTNSEFQKNQKLQNAVEARLLEFLSDEREIFLKDLMSKYEESQGNLISERTNNDRNNSDRLSNNNYNAQGPQSTKRKILENSKIYLSEEDIREYFMNAIMLIDDSNQQNIFELYDKILQLYREERLNDRISVLHSNFFCFF